MAITVEEIQTVDMTYRNGDPYWDGDQTLHRLVACDGERRAEFRVVVLRGDAFITAGQVKQFGPTP